MSRHLEDRRGYLKDDEGDKDPVDAAVEDTLATEGSDGDAACGCLLRHLESRKLEDKGDDSAKEI